MNVASYFSAYRLLEESHDRLETELRRERTLRRRDALEATRERQKLTDALARSMGRPPVFTPAQTPTQNKGLVIGTMGAQIHDAQVAKEREDNKVVKVPEAILVGKANGRT